jgi:hypothetical protein
MSFVFGVMVEYTVAHFAKNQEMLHRPIPPNLLVDSTLSTLLGGTNSSVEPAANEHPPSSASKRNKSTAHANHTNQTGRSVKSGAPTVKYDLRDTSSYTTAEDRTYRPDEPDLHTIRTFPPIENYAGEIEVDVGDDYLLGYEEDLGDGYMAESELGRAYINVVGPNLLQHRGSGMLYK